MTWTPQLLQSMIYRSFCICQMQGKEPVKLLLGPDTVDALKAIEKQMEECGALIITDCEKPWSIPTEMFGMPVAAMPTPGIAVVGNSP
jgi:hypothetical protein